MIIVEAYPLQVDASTRPGYLRVTSDWILRLADFRRIVVPAGFWCDGASIPAFARPWFSPLVLIALGVAHDYAVREGASIRGLHRRDDRPIDFSASLELAIALAELAGIGRTKRWCIATALRIAARTYWHRRPMDWTPVHDSRTVREA